MDETAGMKNLPASKVLHDCLHDLDVVKATLVGLEGAPAAPYLKKYSVIRASGSIEFAFKMVIADRVDQGSHEQARNFVRAKVRNTSKNPKLGAIESSLAEFDPRWSKRFNELVSLANRARLSGALTSLVNARNKFAHGGDSDISIESIIEHFRDGAKVIAFLDQTVHETYEESLDQALVQDEDTEQSE
jgi:hypothetical protein